MSQTSLGDSADKASKDEQAANKEPSLQHQPSISALLGGMQLESLKSSEGASSEQGLIEIKSEECKKSSGSFEIMGEQEVGDLNKAVYIKWITLQSGESTHLETNEKKEEAPSPGFVSTESFEIVGAQKGSSNEIEVNENPGLQGNG